MSRTGNPADPAFRAHDAPAVFGRYRLRRVLGQGAMGKVWLAWEPVTEREVALKLLHNRWLRADFQQRFAREIRLLGALEHPHIARLYEAGTLEEGASSTPYLAMEYVRGLDLRQYTATHTLTIDQRLELIARVARAMHYAHTRGVVHRDLKPENILVDDHGAPRVLDFGIAHVAGSDRATQMTMTGEILGTLAYVSPEQLAGAGADVDPRMDVYALGVVAYELIAGGLPHPGLNDLPLTAAILAVTQQRPQPISKRVRAARGDVETIVMKAIDPDRSQRYASAADLAADIERYLGRQPIAARPPSTAHVVRLFAKRHKALTTSLAVAAISLLAATAASTHFALSESKARQRAEAHLAERVAVSEFLQDMLTAADPERALGERLTVLDVLDVARAKLDKPDVLPPAVAAQLHHTLGNIYSGLGRGETALDSLERAAALQPEPDANRDIALTLDRASALAAAGREADALNLIEQILIQLDGAAGAADPLRFDAQLRKAALLDQRGYLEEAENLLRALLDQTGRSAEAGLRLHSTLAMNLHKQARYADSIELARLLAEQSERIYGTRHPRTLEALEIVAINLRDLAHFDEAEAIYRRTLSDRVQVLGDEHPLTHQTRGGLAAVLAFKGEVDEARTLIERGYQGMLDVAGIDAEATRILANLYAHVASQQGDYVEAIRVLRILVAQNDAMPGGPSATDLADYNNLAFNLMRSGRCAEALPVQHRLLELAVDQLGDEHLHTALFRVNHATCLAERGEAGLAVDALTRAVTVMQAALGAEHPRTVSARTQLQELQDESG